MIDSIVLCIRCWLNRLLMNSVLVIRVSVSRVKLVLISWNSRVLVSVSGGRVCS